jgi:rhamnose transport system substrate-binding protein
LKLNTAGRWVAIVSTAAMLFAACGGTTATPAATAAPSTAAEGITVGYLPKDIVNQYFAAAKTGVDKAAAELGGTVTQVGPNEAKADLQIPFITDLTTQGVKAIIISADGKDEVAPALKEAMKAGIKVVGFDSSPAVGAYDVFVNQVDFSGVGVNLADWACELAPSCAGEIAILSAAATATNQNEWIELMKTTLKEDKYKGLTLVDTVYGNDDATESTKQAQGLLTKYPNLKVIVAPTTVGILAAAQEVSKQGKSADVKVTGLGFPNDMKPFVKDGTSPVFGLWSVPDLGYLSYVVADKLVKGEITGKEGETFTVKGLNNDQPYTIGKDGIVILGPAFRFDATNVENFNF